jgi:hypothetical protein
MATRAQLRPAEWLPWPALPRKPRNMPYVADFNPNVPSIARVYDYFNGGKDNFAADRELAQHLIDIFPRSR